MEQTQKPLNLMWSWFTLFFLVLFAALQQVFTNYFATDRLPLMYFFIAGFASAIMAIVLHFIIRGKSLAVKIGVAVLLLVIAIVSVLMTR